MKLPLSVSTQTQPIAMITQQQSLTRIAYEANVVSDINTQPTNPLQVHPKSYNITRVWLAVMDLSEYTRKGWTKWDERQSEE